MAPGTRRANRAGYAEHDDLEGLPVRQWRQELVNVAPPPPPETIKQNDVWSIELFRGMPKDSHLLPPHSQELLRAARSGRLYKRPAPTEEEDADADAVLPDKPEKKDEDPSTKGFMVRQWKAVPRNAEGPDISHLAKRRKGTITIASRTVVNTSSGNTITRATVRRLDAAGNPYTQEVTLVAGQQVEGEIISTSVVAAPVQNGDFPSQQLTPMRRRPPPPKRKAKGPGRGRKKKFPVAASTRSATGGIPGSDAAQTKLPGVDQAGVKKEGEDSNNKDVEMGDNSVAHSDDEEGDDGDDNEEGDEGEGDDHERDSRTPDTASQQQQDQEMADAPALPSEPPVVAKEAATAPGEPENLAAKRQGPVMNPLNLAPPFVGTLASGSPRLEGSPLKNVILPSPTRTSPPATNLQAPTTGVPESADVVMTEDQALQPEEPKEDLKEAQQGVPTEPAKDEPAEEPKEVSQEKPKEGQLPESETADALPSASPSKPDLPAPVADVEMAETLAAPPEPPKAVSPVESPQRSPPETSQEASENPKDASMDVQEETPKPDTPPKPAAVSNSLPSLRPDGAASHPQTAPPAATSPEEKELPPASKLAPSPPSIQEPEPTKAPPVEPATEVAKKTPPPMDDGPDLLGSLMTKLDREEKEIKSQTTEPPAVSAPDPDPAPAPAPAPVETAKKEPSPVAAEPTVAATATPTEEPSMETKEMAPAAAEAPASGEKPAETKAEGDSAPPPAAE